MPLRSFFHDPQVTTLNPDQVRKYEGIWLLSADSVTGKVNLVYRRIAFNVRMNTGSIILVTADGSIVVDDVEATTSQAGIAAIGSDAVPLPEETQAGAVREGLKLQFGNRIGTVTEFEPMFWLQTAWGQAKRNQSATSARTGGPQCKGFGDR